MVNKFFLILVISAVMVSGCTEKIQKPTVSISDVSVKNVSLRVLNLDVRAIVDNQNPISASLSKIVFDIYYLKDGKLKYLGHGEKYNIDIRKEGQTAITIPVMIDNLQAIKAIKEIARKGDVTIKISGSAYLDFKLTTFEIPFEVTKDVTIRTFEEKTSTPTVSPTVTPSSETPTTNEPSEQGGISVEGIDCGTDFDCFIKSSQNCSPAKVTNTVTADLFRVKQTTTSLLEIKGIESDKCIFYIRTEKIDVTFTPETPQEKVDQLKEIYKKLEGRDGTCKFNTNDLTSMLNRWKEGAFSTEDWNVAECQGDYFSQQI